MAPTYKPVGKAVATARGHYPLGGGRTVVVLPGQTFEVFEGMTKAKWFTVLPADTPAPAPVVAPVASEPDTLAAAAVVERKRKAAVKPPTADEIA